MSGFSKLEIVSHVPGVACVRAAFVCGCLCACVVGLSGCADSEVSAQSGGAQSVEVAQSVDVVMSGGYEVGANGKLLSPLRGKEIPAPQRSWESQKPGKEGAEEFARYVLELFPYTWMSGDTSKFEDISHPDCKWCQNILIKPTKERSSNGGWIGNVSYTVHSVGPAFQISGHEEIWNVDLNLTRSAFSGYDGEKIVTAEEHQEKILFQVQFVNGQWLL